MSDPKAPAATEADIYSYLFSDTAGTRAVPPILSLHVARWANAPASGLKGVVAEIFQCWYDKDATGNAQPSWHHSLAKFTIDLAPNPAASATPDGKGSPPEIVISNPKLTTTYGRKGTALSKPVKADDADFIFSMGGPNTFPIVVPEKFKDSGEARNNPHLHGDAGKHRIGVELTAVVNKKTVKYSALDWDHTLRSTIQCSDPVDRMLALQTTPMGAFKTITDAKVVGRFSDPKRNPRIDPDKAPKDLDKAILDARTTALKGKDPDPTKVTLTEHEAVDMDGLRFKNFVPAADRRKKLDELFEAMKKKLAKGTRTKELKATDVQRAYFFFHDTGAGSAKRADESEASELVGAESVNGYINKKGTYAIHEDFDVDKGGTILEWVITGEWIHGYCAGVETVPVVETNATDKDDKFSTGSEKKYASIGWYHNYPDNGVRHDVWWKWPDSILDTFAQLYVFLSARANHLLTITPHMEADKNLMYSNVFWSDISKWSSFDAATDAKIKNPGTLWHKIANKKKGYRVIDKKTGKKGWVIVNDGPGSMHDDPLGLDFQVLYDKITDQLNALGGLKVPHGVRYGCHPKRVVTWRPKKDNKDVRPHVDDHCHPHALGNGSEECHTFPHQSDPEYRASPKYVKEYKTFADQADLDAEAADKKAAEDAKKKKGK